MNIHRLFLLLATLFAWNLFAADKAPVPDAKAQAEALKTIKEVFQEDYAKSKPEEKLALAKKLLTQFQNSKDDDAPTRYVLLTEAAAIASKSGDAYTALLSIERIETSFQVDATLMRATLVALESSTKDSDVLKFIAAVKVLLDKPEDPTSNLSLGLYLCLLQDNWLGLKALAKGSDPVLKDLAEKELSKPEDAKGQATIGDGWWDFAEKESNKIKKKAAQERAKLWYEKALPSLTGLSKSKIEKRLQTTNQPRSIDLLPLVDIQRDKVTGDWSLQNSKLYASKDNGNARLDFPYTPPDEYDLRVVFSKESGGNLCLFGKCSGKTISWQIGTSEKDKGGPSQFCSYAGVRNETEVDVGKSILDGQKHTVVMQVRKDKVMAIFDGKTVTDFKTDFSKMDMSIGSQDWWHLRSTTTLGLGAGKDKTTFYSAELIEISGKGKPTGN